MEETKEHQYHGFRRDPKQNLKWIQVHTTPMQIERDTTSSPGDDVVKATPDNILSQPMRYPLPIPSSSFGNQKGIHPMNSKQSKDLKGT